VRLVFRHGQTLLAASGPLVEASLLAPSALLQGMLLEGDQGAEEHSGGGKL
jgi:hypothetical protein